jgi:hypothetical protein
MGHKKLKHERVSWIILLVLTVLLVHSASVFARTGVNQLPDPISEKDQLTILFLLILS